MDAQCRSAEARFVELLDFEVAMDLGWVVTVASPTNPSAQVSIIGNDDPAAPGISIEVDDVDAAHAGAVERGLEITCPVRDEEVARNRGPETAMGRPFRWIVGRLLAGL